MGAQQSTEEKNMSEADVKALISSADVVLFVDSGCPYCSDAVAALKAKGVAHKVVEANSAQRATLRSMTTQSSVPNCWVKGVFVGGCNDGTESWMGIKKMLNNGELAKRLGN